MKFIIVFLCFALSALSKVEETLPPFPREGLEDIALITVVKNEEDIIFENLAWHFAIGFRKFIILDNGSTDKTLDLIKKFRTLAGERATVFIINDPITAHIQGRKMTGAYQFASRVWDRDLKWVFPVDADEFWIPTTPLKEILKNLPEKISTFAVHSYKYHPTDKGSYTKPFYETITHHAQKPRHQKIFLRASLPHISIAEGNHCSTQRGNPFHHCGKLKRAKTLEPFHNVQTLRMYEYYMRSEKQAHSKMMLGGQSNIIAQRKGLIGKACSAHQTGYLKLYEKHGKEAARKVFEAEQRTKGDPQLIEDPLPLKRALDFLSEASRAG